MRHINDIDDIMQDDESTCIDDDYEAYAEHFYCSKCGELWDGDYCDNCHYDSVTNECDQW